jgi:uncharacterized membrane-anchored protein YhcB (DUF1043 family)
MHKHRHRHGRRCHGFGRELNAEKLLERLEEYQRDLEQEVADVADLIRRLKVEPQQTATV